jgi:hypothetical protein
MVGPFFVPLYGLVGSPKCAVLTAFVAEWLRRYVQVVVNFVGAGSSPVECMFYFFSTQM